MSSTQPPLGEHGAERPKGVSPVSLAAQLEAHATSFSSREDIRQGNGLYEPRLRDMPLRVAFVPRLIALSLIRLYQMTASRLLPADTCRFYPTCSHYAYQAIYKYGLIKGSALAAWRVLRCNPFNRGGFDPVP